MTARLSSNKNVYLAPSVPSLQYVGGSSVGGSFTYGASSAYEVWQMRDDPANLTSFIAEVLGYSRRHPVNATQIARALPARHPDIPWIWASKVGWEGGFGPTGQRAGLSHATASYKYLQCRVEYESPPYAILPDGVLEQFRFVILTEEPSGDFLTRRYGSYAWVAGTPDQSGVTLADGIPQLLIKNRLNFTWVQVPDDGFFTNGGQAFQGAVPQKALDGLGKVNDAEFMGYPAGTLLLEGFKLTPVLMPIDPLILGLPGDIDGGSYPTRAWNVDYFIDYFNPPINEDAGFTARGHNCFPHPTDPYWYRLLLKGSAGSDTSPYWRYQSYDYNKLFELNV